MEITNKVTKRMNLTNAISIDGTQALLQSYSINENGYVSFSDSITNQDVYRDNREEIRVKMAEFEDYVYEERERIIDELSNPEVSDVESEE